MVCRIEAFECALLKFQLVEPSKTSMFVTVIHCHARVDSQKSEQQAGQSASNRFAALPCASRVRRGWRGEWRYFGIRLGSGEKKLHHPAVGSMLHKLHLRTRQFNHVAVLEGCRLQIYSHAIEHGPLIALNMGNHKAF